MACVRAKEREDVLALTRQINPDIIILDAEFPGDMVGWEIMRALKVDKNTRHIAVIGCSWLSESEVRSLAGRLTAYLQKPDITYHDFETAIRGAGVITKGGARAINGLETDCNSP